MYLPQMHLNFTADPELLSRSCFFGTCIHVPVVLPQFRAHLQRLSIFEPF